MEEMNKIDRSSMFSEVNPKPVSTHNCTHSGTKMESLETAQHEKWSNKPLPPLCTFLFHLMLPKEQWLQCSQNVPIEASNDKLTLIECTGREELGALQREVMPFNETFVRGSKHKSVGAAVWWLKPHTSTSSGPLIYSRWSRALSHNSKMHSLTQIPTQKAFF